MNFRPITTKPFRAGLTLTALALAAASFSANAQVPVLRTITVAGQINMGAACVFVAEAQGYFKDEGLTLSYQDLGSPENAVMATVSGSADVGLCGVTAGFFNLATKDGLKLIASSSMEKKGYQNVGVLATNAAYDGGLKSFKDLAGKRVGLTTTGGPAHYDLAVIAEKSGIDLDKITVVPLQSVPNLVAAFKGGQIDAMLQSPPVPRQIEAQGIGHIVGWASDLVQAQAAVVYTRPATIAKDRALVQSFVNAYVRGCADYNAAFNQLDANGALTKGANYDKLLKALSERVKLPPEQIASGLVGRLTRATSGYLSEAQQANVLGDVEHRAHAIALWKKMKFVGPDTDIEKLVDVSFTDGRL